MGPGSAGNLSAESNLRRWANVALNQEEAPLTTQAWFFGVYRSGSLLIAQHRLGDFKEMLEIKTNKQKAKIKVMETEQENGCQGLRGGENRKMSVKGTSCQLQEESGLWSEHAPWGHR